MPPLLKNRAAWLYVKQWAADEITFLALEEKLSGLGSYTYGEWRETFRKVEELSDPTEDHSISPVNVVLEAAHACGINLTEAQGNATPGPSSIVALGSKRRSGNSSRPRKRRKLAISHFLDLDTAEEEEEEEEEEEDTVVEEGESRRKFDCVRLSQPGRSGLQDLVRNLEDIAERYEHAPHARHASPEGNGDEVRCYMITFHSEHTARFLLEEIKPLVHGVKIIPWVPWRLYIQASSPSDVLGAIPPSHRSIVHQVALVPLAEASQIFAAPQRLPDRSWVRAKRGKYKNDLGYILRSKDNAVEVLFVPRQRPYDPPEERARGTRALFDWQTANDSGLELSVIDNSRGITAFHYKDSSYFAGLIRLSLAEDDLTSVLIPPPEELALFESSSVDTTLVEESYILFSSQFWTEGDIVRSSSSSLLGQIATVVGVDFEKRIVDLLHDDCIHHCPVVEQRCVLSPGDHVQFLVGPNRGEVGIVIQALEDKVTVTLPTDLAQEISISIHLLRSCSPDHCQLTIDSHESVALSHPLSEIQLGLQPGDAARITSGPHRGLIGNIDMIDADEGLVWIVIPEDTQNYQPNDEYAGLGNDVVAACTSQIISSQHPNLIKFTKEKGWDVSIGDRLRIARGEYWGNCGVATKVRWFEAQVDIALQDGVVVMVPISCCVKVTDFTQREASKLVGKEVWVISGEFKGRRGTLYTLGSAHSVVSLPGHPVLNLPNSQLAATCGICLDGQMLCPALHQQVMSLYRASFTPSIPRAMTPPPSPKASSSIDPAQPVNSAWTVTPEDVTPLVHPPSNPHGRIPWLFDDVFCDFAGYHLAFNIDLRYQGGSFRNRVARMTCSDRFNGPSGPAPENHISVMVPGHNRGSGVQHHFIPAEFLKPALPTSGGNGKYALILSGGRAGEIHSITKYRCKKREVELSGSIFSCDDICPAYPHVC